VQGRSANDEMRTTNFDLYSSLSFKFPFNIVSWLFNLLTA